VIILSQIKYSPDAANVRNAGLQLAVTFFTAVINYYKHNFLLKPSPQTMLVVLQKIR
jgi:hypothetical protein